LLYVPRFGHILFELKEELKARVLELATKTGDDLVREALEVTHRMSWVDEIRESYLNAKEKVQQALDGQ
jgi:hypothetical protein